MGTRNDIAQRNCFVEQIEDRALKYNFCLKMTLLQNAVPNINFAMFKLVSKDLFCVIFCKCKFNI